MQSRSRWDFFDMQIESANKGGGDEEVFFISTPLPLKKERKKQNEDIWEGIVVPFHG